MSDEPDRTLVLTVPDWPAVAAAIEHDIAPGRPVAVLHAGKVIAANARPVPPESPQATTNAPWDIAVRSPCRSLGRRGGQPTFQRRSRCPRRPRRPVHPAQPGDTGDPPTAQTRLRRRSQRCRDSGLARRRHRMGVLPESPTPSCRGPPPDRRAGSNPQTVDFLPPSRSPPWTRRHRDRPDRGLPAWAHSATSPAPRPKT